MSFVFLEILIPLIIAFLLGLLFGWFWWGWRRTKITYTEWETMRQKANRASSVESRTELAELQADHDQLQADRDRLQAQIDEHVCDTSTATGEAELGTGVLGLSGAAAVATAGSDEDASDAEAEVVEDDPAGADDAGSADSASGTADTDVAGVDVADSDSSADAAAVLDERHPYGEGSHAQFADDPKAQPEGYNIKGNADSMLYHRPDSRSYKVTIAEVWFDSAERAEAAGFGLAGSHPKD